MALPSKNSFVASLFVMSLCALLVGGIDLAANIQYWRYGEPAVLSLADPDKKVVKFEDSMSWTVRDVKLSGDAGVIVVPDKRIAKTVAAQLDIGQSLPVVYMTNNPKHIFYNNDKPDSPWLWLGIGGALMLLAIFALRLRKREAGV